METTFLFIRMGFEITHHVKYHLIQSLPLFTVVKLDVSPYHLRVRLDRTLHLHSGLFWQSKIAPVHSMVTALAALNKRTHYGCEIMVLSMSPINRRLIAD